jgi:hypothetical protein
MATKRVFDEQRSFVGGLNQSVPNDQIADNEMSFTQNVRLSKPEGWLQRRGGSRNLSTTYVTITQGMNWHDASVGGNRFDIGYVNGTGHLWAFRASPNTVAPLDLGATSGGSWVDFAPFRSATSGLVLYVGTSGGVPVKMNSIGTITTLSGKPTVEILAVYNSRLFAADNGVGNPGAPPTLYWSALNDGDTLGDAANGGGSAILTGDATNLICGLKTLGNSLFIFRKRGIARFTGWSQTDFNLQDGSRGITPTISARGQRVITTLGDHIYFWGTDGCAYR